MSTRFLLATAGAFALSVATIPASLAAGGAQECLARMGDQKMTAAEWTACACQGVAQSRDPHVLAQVAATTGNICAGVATDTLVRLLATPVPQPRLAGPPAVAAPVVAAFTGGDPAVSAVGSDPIDGEIGGKSTGSVDPGKTGGPTTKVISLGAEPGKTPISPVAIHKPSPTVASAACSVGGKKMSGAQRIACACQAVARLTSTQVLARIAATKLNACAGVAAERLAQLMTPPAVVARADSGNGVGDPRGGGNGGGGSGGDGNGGGGSSGNGNGGGGSGSGGNGGGGSGGSGSGGGGNGGGDGGGGGSGNGGGDAGGGSSGGGDGDGGAGGGGSGAGGDDGGGSGASGGGSGGSDHHSGGSGFNNGGGNGTQDSPGNSGNTPGSVADTSPGKSGGSRGQGGSSGSSGSKSGGDHASGDHGGSGHSGGGHGGQGH